MVCVHEHTSSFGRTGWGGDAGCGNDREDPSGSSGEGVPIKKIARDLRVSKNTVRKVVRGDATSFSYERKIQPMPKLGPWVEELERQLKANEKKARKDRLSLLRIHEDLVSLGYKGGYDAVRRVCQGLAAPVAAVVAVAGLCAADLRSGRGLPVRLEPRVRASGGCDDQGEGGAHALCHSRMYLVQIFPRESQEMVFEAHERAFRFFGGVCRRGIYDNMKDGGEHDLRGQEAGLQPPLPGAVLAPSGGACGVHARGWLGEGAG